jgi:formylmethanofuran dehydrogenase subunit E
MSIDPESWKLIRALADRLIASCVGGLDEVENIAELTPEQCKVLDTMALECVTCNQWFDVKEVRDIEGEYICADCAQ